MLKEATFYKVIQDFKLTNELSSILRDSINKDTLLFVTEVSQVADSELFKVTLIIDYKEYKSIWHPDRFEDFLIEIS